MRASQPWSSVDTSFFGRIRGALRRFTQSSPSRFAILVFTSLILLWTIMLASPLASADGQPVDFVDALFTAVSTICVTGLATVDMSTQWSVFGDIVILVGIQIGAVGVLSLASILGLAFSRRLGLRQKLVVASDTNPLRSHSGPVSESQAVRLGEIGGILRTVIITLLVVEVAVTVFTVPRFLLLGYDFAVSLWYGFFYAASAFTNTGFTPNAEGIALFESDVYMLTVLGIAVFLGSLGFPVIFALAKRWKHRTTLSVHVKLTVATTLILLVLGAAAIYVLEIGNSKTLGGQPPWLQPITAVFMSAMTRSGGFSTIDIASTDDATRLVMDMLMFVGGGSASTAGGIKVTTLAVLFLAAIAEAKGDDDMQVFRRRIPTDVLRVAVSITLWGASIVALSSLLLMQLTGETFSFVLFDVISAFATTGLSNGLTSELNDPGKLVLAATMWAGRVGTATLGAALAAKQRRQLFRYAEERVIVG